MAEPDTTARPRCRDLNPRDVIVWTGQPRPNDFAKVIERRKDDDSGWWMTDGSGLADYVWDGGAAWQTVRALCDGYDEAQRLRDEVVDLWECDGCGFAFPSEYHDADDPTSHTCPVCAEARLTDQRDAARQALADLIGELRGLCDEEDGTHDADLIVYRVRACLDRHDPEERS